MLWVYLKLVSCTTYILFDGLTYQPDARILCEYEKLVYCFTTKNCCHFGFYFLVILLKSILIGPGSICANDVNDMEIHLNVGGHVIFCAISWRCMVKWPATWIISKICEPDPWIINVAANTASIITLWFSNFLVLNWNSLPRNFLKRIFWAPWLLNYTFPAPAFLIL